MLPLALARRSQYRAVSWFWVTYLPVAYHLPSIVGASGRPLVQGAQHIAANKADAVIGQGAVLVVLFPAIHDAGRRKENALKSAIFLTNYY